MSMSDNGMRFFNYNSLEFISHYNIFIKINFYKWLIKFNKLMIFNVHVQGVSKVTTCCKQLMSHMLF